MTVKVRAYKRGGWEVDITLMRPDGTKLRERLRSPVPSKSGSLRWGEERERHLLFHREPVTPKEVPTLSEFKDRYMSGYVRANRLKPSGIAAKETVFKIHLIPALGAQRLDAISNERVQRLKGALAHRNAKTVNNVLTVLNTVLKAAVEWKVIAAMPCTIRLLKVIQRELGFYDFDDYERLVEGAAKAGSGPHLVVLLGGDAGLRLGEIVALEQTDVDFKRNTILVQRSDWCGETSTPKSGKPRRIPMTKRLAAALLANRHLRGARVLYREGGEPLTKKVVRNWVASAQRRAAMPVDSKVHKLRHTFCSHLAMRGAPARAIQDLAGHTDLTTTQRYMHLSPAVVDAAIRLLDTGRETPGRGDILETGEAG